MRETIVDLIVEKRLMERQYNMHNLMYNEMLIQVSRVPKPNGCASQCWLCYFLSLSGTLEQLEAIYIEYRKAQEEVHWRERQVELQLHLLTYQRELLKKGEKKFYEDTTKLDEIIFKLEVLEYANEHNKL